MQRPRIIVNFAITVDGKVSTSALTPARFTSSNDKHRLLEIRSLGDALLVGRNTVQIDNMSMGLPDEDLRTARVQRGQTEYPLRVVVSNSGNLSTDLNIFNHRFSPIVIYSTTSMPEAVKAALQTRATLHLADADRLSLPEVLSDLYRTHRVHTLVCEGGPSLAKGLAEIDAIDELFLTIAPLLFGGAGAPGILGNLGKFLPSSRIYRLNSMNVESTECYLHYVADRP
ncbi:MAG: RibD family protein [Verrucomicrobia bacterium]|nr:RibD family protein [Verrucomicrobiota bacterium]